jgi:hypothetical protein
MDRRSGWCRHTAIAVILVAVALAGSGCNVLTMFAYLVQGPDSPPDFAGLKDKKVVVVCRPHASLSFRDAGAARDLAEQISKLLGKNVPKIKVIDQQKLAVWADQKNPPWREFREVGEALKADMVVGIDLTSFSLGEGPTLYRGRASLDMKVYDLSKEKGQEVVFEKSFPQAVYPPNLSVPISEKSEPEFRHEFVLILADQLARHFYAHDQYADVGLDSRAGLK